MSPFHPKTIASQRLFLKPKLHFKIYTALLPYKLKAAPPKPRNSMKCGTTQCQVIRRILDRTFFDKMEVKTDECSKRQGARSRFAGAQ
jgi:hypothetical protein